MELTSVSHRITVCVVISMSNCSCFVQKHEKSTFGFFRLACILRDIFYHSFNLLYSANVLDNSKGAIKSKKVIKTIKRNGADSSSNAQSLNRTSNTSNVSSSWSPHHVSSSSLTSASPPHPTSTSSSYTSAQSKYPTNVANSRTTAAKKLEKLKRKNQAKMNTAAKEAAQSYSKSNGLSKSEKEKAKAALVAVPLR